MSAFGTTTMTPEEEAEWVRKARSGELRAELNMEHCAPFHSISKPAKPLTHQRHFVCPDDVWDQIEALAGEYGKSRSAIVIWLVKASLPAAVKRTAMRQGRAS